MITRIVFFSVFWNSLIAADGFEKQTEKGEIVAFKIAISDAARKVDPNFFVQLGKNRHAELVKLLASDLESQKVEKPSPALFEPPYILLAIDSEGAVVRFFEYYNHCAPPRTLIEREYKIGKSGRIKVGKRLGKTGVQLSLRAAALLLKLEPAAKDAQRAQLRHKLNERERKKRTKKKGAKHRKNED